MDGEQKDLFAPDIVAPKYEQGYTLEQRFRLFDEANPAVERAIVKIARELRDAHGFKRAGIALIFERLRWLYALRTNGSSYKLNNSFRAFYARRIMARHVDLDGFFEVREQRAV